MEKVPAPVLDLPKSKLDLRRDRITIPAHMHPAFRTEHAIQQGTERNLLFRTWGGLGDQICAEPTLRYALKMFKDCRISLETEHPELFRHLKFAQVFDSKEVKPNYEKYFVFETITPPDDSNMVWLFFSHMLTNCVDFPSLCSLRLQLPVAEKEIILKPKEPVDRQWHVDVNNSVLIHAGKHWQSKTFPKRFWDDVLAALIARGVTPVLIGADTDDNRGTVDVSTFGCIDLRNKLSINDSLWLCQQARVLLTNDSSPLHMAASGKAWIGYIATCKHPDMITHWRNGQWQWREVNFGCGGIWDLIDFCPNKPDKVEAEFVKPEILESWLPDPKEYAQWAVDRLARTVFDNED